MVVFKSFKTKYVRIRSDERVAALCDEVQGHTAAVYSCTWLDPNSIASASFDGTLKVCPRIDNTFYIDHVFAG